jgi:hypothetical protein
MVNGTHLKKFTTFDKDFFYNLASTKFIMPEKVNGNRFSGKSNIASLNSGNTLIDSKSAIQLKSTDHKLATLQKMANNSPYSQRYTQLKSLANKTTPSHQPVSQLSKDSHSLPDNVKQGVESLSGISMDDVKVHYNSAKPAQLNAHAYAQGTDIHIASGQEKHLPHEAWHVVQQKQGRVRPTTMMKAKVPINDDAGLEKEADVMGARALQMKPFSLSDYKTGKSVQRKGVVQKVGEKWEYPEGEKPEIPVSELINRVQPKNADPESNEADVYPEKSIVPVTENPMIEKSSEEISSNQRLKLVSSVIIALSTNIKKIKEKNAREEEAEKAKEEEARLAKVEADIESAKVAVEEARKAAVEATRIAAVASEAARIATETAAAAEAARLAAAAAAAEAARIAAENIAIAALNKAETQAEKVGRKLGDYLDGDSTIGNFFDIASAPLKTMDTVAKYMEAGSEKRRILEENVGKGAFVGNLADTCELLSTAGKFYNSEKKPSDLALLGLTVGKFVTGVVDSVDTASKGGLIGEALSNSISLLPGIKAGLGAFKNGVEAYQIHLKQIALNELLEISGHLEAKEKEILEKYSTALKWKLREIGVDFMLNAAEAVAMIYPPAQVFIAGLHAAINLFKFGCKQYYSYQDDKERKSSERIGDINVEKLKTDKIEEKSGRVGFKDAIIVLSRIKDLEEKETQSPPNITEEEKNELSTKKSVLKYIILIMNSTQTSDSPITQDNLNSFLEFEQEAINNIAAEVKKDEARILKFSRLFHIPQKEGIIKEMKDGGIFQANDHIKLEDIHKLDPAHQNYFFEKTQIAIRTASDRKHISSNERLDMMEKMLLTKFDDVIIKDYMIEKYKDQDIYDAGDTSEIKFKNSVKKFKLEMKLD